MRRFSIFLVFVLAGLLFACSDSPTQPSTKQSIDTPVGPELPPPTGVLNGVVRDASSSQPLAGVNVIWAGLAEAWGDRGHGVTTGADGTYRLSISHLGGPGSATGTIDVQASKPGYVPQVVQVSVVGEVTQDFQLVPADPADK